jgi:hypothetical protein
MFFSEGVVQDRVSAAASRASGEVSPEVFGHTNE